MTVLDGAACTGSGVCVAVGDGGVVVLRGRAVADEVSDPGLAATGVACASRTQCVIAEAKAFLSFDPETKAFGKARPWPLPAGPGAAISCPSPSSCEAVASTYSGTKPSAMLVRVDPETGAVSSVTTMPGVSASSVACPLPTACVAVGEAVSGAYPKLHETPVIIPVRAGVPQAAVRVTASTGSDGLTGVSCAEGPRRLAPGTPSQRPVWRSGPQRSTAVLVSPRSAWSWL